MNILYTKCSLYEFFTLRVFWESQSHKAVCIFVELQKILANNLHE